MEYRTDDARLTIEVMKEAVKFGAEPVNYSKVKELLYEKGKAVGVLIEDVLTKKEYKVYAKKLSMLQALGSISSEKKTIRKTESICSIQKAFTLYLTSLSFR